MIVTAAGPQMHDVLHDLALPTFARYAARWDYALEAADLVADGRAADAGARSAKWQKVALLRGALARYPLVIWLDADVLLLRDDEDIATHVHPTAFQALALEQVPAEHRVNPNTGVWLLRSGPDSVAFLDRVAELGTQPGPWADQGAVLAALGWNHGDEDYHWAGPGRGNAYLCGTSWLPPGWNQPYVSGRIEADVYNGRCDSYLDRPLVDRPHALHFMGMTPDARYRHMSAMVVSAGLRATRAHVP